MPSSESNDVFPLPFIPVVDPLQPCRAYRLTPDGTSIQRSLDSGVHWMTVLDGSTMSARPRFRRIVIGGQFTNHPIVYVSEVANGDALLRSADGGSTWQLADGSTPSGNSPVNLVGTFVFSVTTSDIDPNLLYVIEAECQDSRPHPATSCAHQPYTTSESLPPNATPYVGGVRLYVSRDAGTSWERLADPNADSNNGVPDNCDMDWIWIASDPQSKSPGGVLQDHLWIDYVPASPCVNNQYQVEGTYDSSQPPDGTISYDLDKMSGGRPRTISTKMGPGPFVATLRPGGGVRLVTGNGGNGAYRYSDDDGATWNNIVANTEDLSSGIADPYGNVFAFARVVFGWSEQGSTDEARPYLMTPGPGGYQVHLGATFPPGLSGFGRYGAQWAPFDSHERSLFDWPGLDPLVPPLSDREAVNSLSPISQQRDDTGAYYVVVGTICDSDGCAWDGKVPDSYAGTNGRYATSTWARWQVMRYTPPASIRSLVSLVNAWSPMLGSYSGSPQPSSQAACANTGRCDLVPIAQCTIASDSGDQNGALAFDGKDLLYSVTGERGPQPYTAVLHRVDPHGCIGSGAASIAPAPTITVQFTPAEYDMARALTWLDYGWQGFMSQPAVDRTNPSIDTIAYDATHDRVYFTLAGPPVPTVNGNDQTGVRQENQLSLWSADLHSQAGVPAATVAAHLVTVDTGYCPPTGGGGKVGTGSETLTFDRVDGSVWACLPGRPAKLDTSGHQIDQQCYETPDLQGNDLSGFHVYSWSMQDLQPGAHQHRALLLEDTNAGDARLVQFDLNSCQEGRSYQLVDTPKLQASHGSTSLACDPVTFGDGSAQANSTAQTNSNAQTALATKYPGIVFNGTPLGAVMWAKTGKQLTALLLPDNLDNPQDAQTCRLPVDLTIGAPAASAVGAATGICARLTVSGPDAPIGGQHITAAIDGRNVSTQLKNNALTADGSGQVCLPNQAFAAGQHTVSFSYQPAPSNLAYYPASATATVVVGATVAVVATPNLPEKVLPKPGPPAHLAPFLAPIPVNSSAKAGATVVQGQAQSVAQAQGQPAAAEQREEEKELAFAYEMPDEEQAEDGAPGEPPDGHAMVALGSHNGGDALTGSGVTPYAMATAIVLAGAMQWSSMRRRQTARSRSTRRRW